MVDDIEPQFIAGTDAEHEPIQYLRPDGTLQRDLPVSLDEETLIDMFAGMRLQRYADDKFVSLQRQGRMGTYAPMSGQEAAHWGSIMTLTDEDWVFPSYREGAATTHLGNPLTNILRYWGGDERGSKIPEGVNVFPNAVPIASQTLHAVGAGWASKLKGETGKGFITYFGDGATSQGDFHEAMNFAGVFETPNVFFCNNNGWAISTPVEEQTASETLAQKANAYGFDGILVDGMDPIAVYAVTEYAMEKARSGGGPTMIEALQYRFGAHTTADDPTVYRDEEEVEVWKAKDPIDRMEAYLREENILDDTAIESIESDVKQDVADAVDAYESMRQQEPREMFENVFEQKTSDLSVQEAYVQRIMDEYGEPEQH